MSEKAPDLTPEQERLQKSRDLAMSDAENDSILAGPLDGDGIPTEVPALDVLHEEAEEEDLEREANLKDDLLRAELDEKGNNGRLVE